MNKIARALISNDQNVHVSNPSTLEIVNNKKKRSRSLGKGPVAMCYDLGKGSRKSLYLTIAHKQKWFKISKTRVTLGKQPANNQ